MITTVTVLSYEAMRERARHDRIPATACVVSIIDPEEEPIFAADTDRIITVRFHDLDPEWPVDPERDPRPSYVFMSEEDAKRIVDHVVRFHEHPERWECLVHCMAGVSRSGAVGTFARRLAAISYGTFKKRNPGLHPNRHVLRLLVQELRTRTVAGRLIVGGLTRREIQSRARSTAPTTASDRQRRRCR